MVNSNNDETASWSFRKAPGFFDIVTYTGSSSARTISHNLGCVPGAIFIKKTSGSDYWAVYHEGLDSSSPEDYYLKLNEDVTRIDDANFWNDTKPTASVFSLGDAGAVNSDGHDYVAYLFAGGEQKGNASTKFGGSDNDYSKVSISTSDLDWSASDDLTIEAWVRVPDVSAIGSNGARVFTRWSSNNYSFLLSVRNDGSITFGHGNGGGSVGGAPDSTTGHITDNTWHHIAVTRDGSSNTGTFWIDGTSRGTISSWSNASTNSSEPLYIGDGELSSSGYFFDGYISNARITIGQKLYTSNFTPSTTPLTTTSQGATASNVKFLGCNDPDQRSSTKTPGAITLNGDVEGSNLSPFSSSTGSDYIFGESEDQNVIKTGSYIGNGNADGPEINLGWEPQWLLFKNSNAAENWRIYDSMRGWITHGDDMTLLPNEGMAEVTNQNLSSITATGFKVVSSDAAINTNNHRIIYIAIRRPDGYVGKPAEAGTDVFTMAYGTGTDPNPRFVPGFPVDFSFIRRPGTTENWTMAARLMQAKYMIINQTGSEGNDTNIVFDYNNGWHKGSGFTNYLSWNWKRHAGFDVVTWDGDNQSNRGIAHSMNKIPEMLWIKNRDQSGYYWRVYHKDFHSTSPWNYGAVLNSNAANAYQGILFGSQAPTSTSFYVGRSTGWDDTNRDGYQYIGMLFSSVEGISKVGSYTGNGTSESSTQTITTGFQPRFVIVKSTAAQNWYLLDTTRGWQSGNDNILKMNSDAQEVTNWSFGQPTSTGFTLDGHYTSNNENGTKYIYYAHS